MGSQIRKRQIKPVCAYNSCHNSLYSFCLRVSMSILPLLVPWLNTMPEELASSYQGVDSSLVGNTLLWYMSYAVMHCWLSLSVPLMQ